MLARAATVDGVDRGDHACLTFSDEQERLDLVAAFVRQGLRRGEKVVCWTETITPGALLTELVSRAVRPGAALRRGQLWIAAPSSAVAPGDTQAGRAAMVDLLSAELEQACRQGYAGLRVTADMWWATRPQARRDDLLGFETNVAALVAGGRLCLICQYDRDRFDAATLAFAAQAHHTTIAAQVYYEHPLLRICRQYSPPGVRIAGELDYRHRDVLQHALSESIRLDRRPHLHLNGLDYIDAHCAALIVAAASRLPRSRRMTITCRRLVATVLELSGANNVPHLRVHRAHE